MKLHDQIFKLDSKDQFEKLALRIFEYQIENCAVYRGYVEMLNRPEPKTIQEIPFLPISFFKSHKVISGDQIHDILFKSSGTTGERSSHFVQDLSIYECAFNLIYEQQIGSPEGQVILALLPNYLEQGESSLVYMVEHLIQRTKTRMSGFFLNDYKGFIEQYNLAINKKKHVVIFGVSYALLDLAELKPDLSKATIIETGGMKGRRKEITKNELHLKLQQGFNCKNISSEYGMTELLSQAYSNQNGVFNQPAWMKILIRDVNDPLSYVQDGKKGGINIIDLANINSCSFIATQDLGRVSNNQFEILGRFDNSDIRGCNLLLQ
jgi:phenylacetate-coenzyme A ligase PaaK-like adenylate-forming protein